jgi:WD40 repeat protein
VWDLDLEDKKDFVPTTVQIPTEHKSTTWGLALEARPKFDAPLVITYSNDGTIKCWDLSHGQERECVGGRRALNPPPMCVAVVDPAFAHGQFSVLVGCTDEIKMCDLSSIHTNPSAGAIWEVRKTGGPFCPLFCLFQSMFRHFVGHITFGERNGWSGSRTALAGGL